MLLQWFTFSPGLIQDCSPVLCSFELAVFSPAFSPALQGQKVGHDRTLHHKLNGHKLLDKYYSMTDDSEVYQTVTGGSL